MAGIRWHFYTGQPASEESLFTDKPRATVTTESGVGPKQTLTPEEMEKRKIKRRSSWYDLSSYP